MKINYMVFVALLLFPSLVLANIGTPLMWMPGIRLVFFNIVIGIAEGLLIGLLFKTFRPKKINLLKTIGILILANYVSMLVGEWLLSKPFLAMKDYILDGQPLYNAPKFIFMMIGVLFVITIIIEWPFFLWTLRYRPKRLLKSFIACPLAHILSYTFLVYMYISVSGYTVYTDFDLTKDLSFSKNNNLWVYYIDKIDGDIYKIHTNGTEKTKILEADIKDNSDMFGRPSLFIVRSDKGNGYDLWLENYKNENGNKKLISNFNKYPEWFTGLKSLESPKVKPEDYYWSFHDVLKLENNKSKYDAEVGFWALEGLLIYDGEKKDNLMLQINFETPFLQWQIRNVNLLPNEQIVCQLGDQVVLIDIEERKIGMLAWGYGAVVGYD